MYRISALDFDSGSGRNPAVFLNPAKIGFQWNIRRSRIFGRMWKTVRNAILISNNKLRSNLSRYLAKCNINTTQCITAADSVLGNRGAASGKKQ